MQIVKSMLDLFVRLSDEDQRLLMREFARVRLGETARRIEESGSLTRPPVSDEELSRLIHEVRAEVLRARGL